jgi:hypothetical protein
LEVNPALRAYAADTISAWLLIQGISGLVSPVVLGLFTTNRVHAVIHLLLAAWGFKAALTTGARGFLWAFSVIMLLAGLLYFLPGGRQWTDLLAINEAGAWLNLGIGTVALIAAGLKPR